jgi:alpha-ketoglutarate-dependent taurine dioxygenase
MDATLTELSPIGAEITGVEIETLLRDDRVPDDILGMLEENGVLVFPALGLDDAQQATFSRRLGETVVKHTKGWSEEYPDVFKISMDRDLVAGAYMKGTFEWHIDGMTLEIPSKASLLTGRVIPDSGSETQFASTYAAYDRLADDEKARCEGLKVWHSLEAAHRRFDPDPTPEILERLRSEPPKLQPLVWTHRRGRKSLVIGTTASHVEGMREDDGAALLAGLLDRATEPAYVYSSSRLNQLVGVPPRLPLWLS